MANTPIGRVIGHGYIGVMEKQTKALRSKRFKSGLTGGIANLAVALPESGLEGDAQLAVIISITLTTLCVIVCQTITDVKSHSIQVIELKAKGEVVEGA
ncbi:MAG: hypothetical protein COA70_10655 [Planctomycetota bacterium]|nr:MAG: hypothetical protein COA70_10655 [Planctomycetota bacterium]